jgi:hypothetical protein
VKPVEAKVFVRSATSTITLSELSRAPASKLLFAAWSAHV